MNTIQRKARGFTLVELLVVIAIIALLAAILFPVFSKAMSKARQTQSLSNLRELTQAMIIFVQDNKNAYPTVNATDITQSWANQLLSYAGNKKIFTSPEDTNGAGYVSYVMNGALVDALGNGILTAAVTDPTDTGLFIDGSSYKFPEAGLLNWAQDSHNGQPSQFVPRDNAYNTSFVDGHVESTNGTKANDNVDSINSPVANAFYGAAGFGWITNPGAGVVLPTSSQFTVATDTAALTISGGNVLEPIWQAAAAGWVASGAQAPVLNLLGAGNWTTGDIGGSSSLQSGQSWTKANAVAKDAVAIIVSTNSRLGLSSISSATALTIFDGANQAIALPGLGTNTLHVYVRDSGSSTVPEQIENIACYKSGNPGFLNTWTGGNGFKNDGINTPWLGTNSTAIQTATDASEISHVAGDPYGIGYCSVGNADPTKVQILAINTGTTIQKYDRSLVEASTPDANDDALTNTAAGQWELTRYVFAVVNDAGGSANAQTANDFLAYVQSTSFRNSLLFKSTFFSP